MLGVKLGLGNSDSEKENRSVFLMFCRDEIACDLCRQKRVVKGAVVGIKSALGKRLAIVCLATSKPFFQKAAFMPERASKQTDRFAKIVVVG